MRHVLGLILLSLSASSMATSVAEARSRTALQRDAEGYAIASCLAAQDQPYLKDQGDGWASAIVQRGKGSLDLFTEIAAAVKAELKKGGMAVIHGDDGPTGDKPMPVMYCNEIINTPAVHAAIAKAMKRLAPAYR